MAEREGRLRRALGRSAAALLVFGALGWGFVWGVSQWRILARYRPPEAMLALPEVRSTPAALARGEHLVHVVAQCAACHGDDLAGRVQADTPLIGRLYASNLTRGRGGLPADWSERDWVRAIRFGVGRDGHALALMPSHTLRFLCDEDLVAIIAYLRSLSPVDHELPKRRVGPLTRLVIATGLDRDLLPAAGIDREWRRCSGAWHPCKRGENTAHGARCSVAWHPCERGENAAHGAYLVEVAGCRVCHGARLRGGLHILSLPGEPPPPDISSKGAIAGWSRRDFLRVMRTGTRPDGRQLSARYMPFVRYGRMSDEELGSILLALRREGGALIGAGSPAVSRSGSRVGTADAGRPEIAGQVLGASAAGFAAMPGRRPPAAPIRFAQRRSTSRLNAESASSR